MTRYWHPQRATIPDQICIVANDIKSNTPTPEKPFWIKFSPYVKNPPTKTLSIKDNLFVGPFEFGQIGMTNSSIFSNINIYNALSSNKIILKSELKHWVINEIIQSGCIGKNGLIENTEFVVVTYGGYSTLILKDGSIYNDIKKGQK